MSYYKFTQPEVLAAFAANREAKRALMDRCAAFAKRFGPEKGTPYYQSRTMRLAGIRFSPKKPGPLWTVSREQTGHFQKPRGSRIGLTGEQRIEQSRLIAEWDTNYPNEAVGMEPVFEAMGAQISFMDGYTLCLHDGVLYYKGEVVPANGVEILGSEYDAAFEANRFRAAEEGGA